MNSIYLILLLALKGFEAASSEEKFSGIKRRCEFGNEAKTSADIEDTRGIFRPRKIEKKSFTFNFMETNAIESNYIPPSRDEAFKAIVSADRRTIDKLIDNDYELFSNGIWSEMIAKKKYAGIKYILSTHFSDEIIHQIVFIEAIETGSTALALFLLKLSKIWLINVEDRAITAALKNHRYKILKFLNSANFDFNQVIDQVNKRHPLHLAVIMDDPQLVKVLLKFRNIMVNSKDKRGNSPLHFCKSVEVAKLLIDNGADLTVRNLMSSLPLETVAKKSLYNVAAFLEPSVIARLDNFIAAMKSKVFVGDLGEFVIDRQFVLEDTVKLVSRSFSWYESRSLFMIQFRGESGIDHGGLYREWMSLLIERFFVPRLKEEELDPIQVGETKSEEVLQQPAEIVPQAQQTSFSTASVNFFIEDESDNIVLAQPLESSTNEYHNDNENETLEDMEEEDPFNFLDFLISNRNLSLSMWLQNRRALPMVSSQERETFYGAPFECVDAFNKMYKISSTFTGPIEVYKLIGSIVGKSILANIPLKVKLVPSLFRLALNLGLTFHDLKDDDPSMYKSMLDILADDFDFEMLGYVLPSDESIPVTKENVIQFLDETAHEVMYRRQKPQIDKFVEGFRSILPYEMVSGYFNVLELQEILYGSDNFMREDLSKALIIAGNAWKQKAQVFWDAIAVLSDTEVIQLIRFITGINGLPYGGITKLDRPIKIFDGIDRLFPRASTCLYTLDLPIQHETVEEVVEALRLAISSPPEFIDGGCCC